MTKYFLSALLFISPMLAAASPPPAPQGKFDCSRAQGTYEVSLKLNGDGAYNISVRNRTGDQETTLTGVAMVASVESSSKPSYNVIRLAGSNVELFFDKEGRIGLDRSALDCRKL
jgi:hypothetical protein